MHPKYIFLYSDFNLLLIPYIQHCSMQTQMYFRHSHLSPKSNVWTLQPPSHFKKNSWPITVKHTKSQNHNASSLWEYRAKLVQKIFLCTTTKLIILNLALRVTVGQLFSFHSQTDVHCKLSRRTCPKHFYQIHFSFPLQPKNVFSTKNATFTSIRNLLWSFIYEWEIPPVSPNCSQAKARAGSTQVSFCHAIWLANKKTNGGTSQNFFSAGICYFLAERSDSQRYWQHWSCLLYFNHIRGSHDFKLKQ